MMSEQVPGQGRTRLHGRIPRMGRSCWITGFRERSGAKGKARQED